MLYRKILFYYSIIISILLFIWVVFFMPGPENLILLLVFLPIPLYFFLTITRLIRKSSKDGSPHVESTQHPKTNKPLIRLGFFVLATLFISTLSITTYSLMHKNLSPTTNLVSDTDNKTDEQLDQILDRLGEFEATSEDNSRQLNKIYLEVSDNAQTEKTLGAFDGVEVETSDDNATPSGYLITKTSKPVDIYSSNSTSAKIIGTAQLSKTYPYIEKVGSWYKIKLSTSEIGWIMAKFVTKL